MNGGKGGNTMNQFRVCGRALQDAGCGVAFVGNTIVRVRFPPDPNDPVAAPDGEEREHSRSFFTLMVTKTFMELLEHDLIDEDGGATDFYKGVMRAVWTT